MMELMYADHLILMADNVLSMENEGSSQQRWHLRKTLVRLCQGWNEECWPVL